MQHLFYGISMLDKHKGTGWKKFLLIFGMYDESFLVPVFCYFVESWGAICHMLLVQFVF